eukprot:gb/GECG01015161.1/.p1 GENE.gb/GECG01015161.1/~~gb/GECG01015161.1/.p1  ORF type:complete len:793 (+),score=103.22 gb/GECG01015161.1/:1-2379(+)
MSIAVPPPVLPSSQQGRNAGRAPLAELTNKQNQGPPSPKHKTGSVQTQHRASSKSSGSNLGEIVEDSRKSSSGSVIVRRYRKDKLLGKGGFAKVYQFTNLENQKVVAGKVVEKSSLTKSSSKQKLLAEIRIHRSLEHQHIVGFESFFEDKHNVYIMLELCSNQTLMEVIKRRKRLTEHEARYFGLQLLDAVRYLHKNNIIHRDLKLGNIFLGKDMQVKVGDFGLAAALDYAEERKQTVCGTPNYIAPEVLRGTGHSSQADIWSFGVIMYTMLVGTPPFETKDVNSTYKRIKSNSYSFPTNCGISSEARELIRASLNASPSRRPSIDQLCYYPFFVKASAAIPRSLPSSVSYQAPDMASVPCDSGYQMVMKMLEQPLRGLRSEIKRKQPVKSAGSSGRKEETNSVREAVRSLTIGDNRTTVKTRNEDHIYVTEDEALRYHGINLETGKDPTATKREKMTVTPPVAPSGTAKSPSGAEPGEPRKTTEALNTASECRNTTNKTNSPKNYSAFQRLDSNKTPAHSGIVEDRKPSYREQNECFQKARSTPKDAKDQIGSPAVDTLRKMQERLSTYEGGGSRNADARDAPQIWIARWLDYTEKYGMAYLLSNGCIGVFFNDTSKLVLASNGEDFEYVERSPSTKHTKHSEHTPVVCEHHTMSNYPDSLKKKVTLVRHFKGFLFEEQRKKGRTGSEEEAAIAKGSGTSDLTFVKKWIKTPDAILFRLSNRTVQVNFKDTSSIILCSESSLVTYADKSGNRSHHVLSKILHEGRPDISRRLRYTRDILHQLSVGKRKDGV